MEGEKNPEKGEDKKVSIMNLPKTMNPWTTRNDVPRLNTLRPSPDLTLGGVKKRDFQPNIPSSTIPNPKKKER